VTAIASATGWYVYGVVDATARESPVCRGVGGGTDVQVVPIRRVGVGSVAAIVSRVDLGEFGETALRERLNDRAWLEANALAHEDVLRAFAAATAVVPLRFGTIYRDAGDVADLLEARAEEFRASLDRVRGRVELGVKAWVDRPRLESVLSGGDLAAPDAPAGRSYLERRLRERKSAEEAAAYCTSVVRDAHDCLRALAVDAVRNRAQPRELTGRPEEMALNAAYLVAVDEGSFAAEVSRLDDENRAAGITFELTGPWPAHNFVEAEDGR
jgi:gas vesicle protein GvpL/GvpF